MNIKRIIKLWILYKNHSIFILFLFPIYQREINAKILIMTRKQKTKPEQE